MKIKTTFLAIFFGVSSSVAIFGQVNIAKSASSSSSTSISRVAKNVTVLINSVDSNGSGVLIRKTGDVYTVLTAAHVVSAKDATFFITTPDGQKYNATSINVTPEADLAVVKFESKTTQQLAKLGDSNKSSEGSTVYVSGFPVATQAINISIYNFTEGKVTANASRPLSFGYSLVYSNNTLPGMSGGPVFNDNGELIAIHGRGDFQEGSKASDINENVRIKTGFNLGITMSTVQKLSSSLGLDLGKSAPITSISSGQISSNQNLPQSSPKISSFPRPAPAKSNSSSISSVEIPDKQAVPDVLPPKADDFFLLGVERFRRGDWAGAAENMSAAIKLNPKYLRAYTARGAANYMQNRVALGLEDMEKAIAINPKYATGYVGKCFLLNELEKWGQALGNCDRAIELNPKLSIAYNVRGVVNTSLKNYAPAQNDLERAIQLDPNSYYAYANLANLYALRQNIQVALRYARQALELNPNSAGARIAFGGLLVLNGEHLRAISEINRAISINPRISGAYAIRALANSKLGNSRQAQFDASFAQGVARSSPQGFIEDLSFLNQ